MDVNHTSNLFTTQWAKSPKRQSEGVHFLLIRHSKYSQNTLLQTAFSVNDVTLTSNRNNIPLRRVCT